MAMVWFVAVVASVCSKLVFAGAMEASQWDSAGDDYDYGELSDAKTSQGTALDLARLLQDVGAGEGEGEGAGGNGSTAEVSFNLEISVNKPAAELENDDFFVQKMREIGSQILFQTSDLQNLVQVTLSDASSRRLTDSAATAHNVVAEYVASVTADQASTVSNTFQNNPPTFEDIVKEFNEAFEGSSIEVDVSEESVAATTSQITSAAQKALEDLDVTSSPTTSPTSVPPPGEATPSPPVTPSPPGTPTPSPPEAQTSSPTSAPTVTPSPPLMPTPSPPVAQTSSPTSAPTDTPTPEPSSPVVEQPTPPPTSSPTDGDELTDDAHGFALSWAAFAVITLAIFV